MYNNIPALIRVSNLSYAFCNFALEIMIKVLYNIGDIERRVQK